MKSSITITSPTISGSSFHSLVLDWFDQHGRKHLPWQQNKTPYRVWISEIMLQQTQVNTVIPYFERFMREFPTIEKLAQAPADAVMHRWAGLGYYSRARNIHRAAKMVVDTFGGEFPDTLEALMQLPGIGRSTAGAILAIAFNQQAVILDGNVKRVLARFACVTGAIDEGKIENQLWTLAEKYVPRERTADYTQAMMDLGATICVRGKPLCELCPLSGDCLGLMHEMAGQLPKKKKGRELPVRTVTFLIVKTKEQVLLQKRPDNGIWGGLWSLPEIEGVADKKTIRSTCKQSLHITYKQSQVLPAFRHTFSHYHLDIHPVLIVCDKKPIRVMEAGLQIWYNLLHPDSVGLPKPVQKLLERLANDATHTLHKTKQRS